MAKTANNVGRTAEPVMSLFQLLELTDQFGQFR